MTSSSSEVAELRRVLAWVYHRTRNGLFSMKRSERDKALSDVNAATQKYDMEVCCDEEGYPLTRLHGLRMLDPDHFSRLPLSSADSCNVARNIGIDKAWRGPYVPKSKWARALVMMDRIEHHASARRWCGKSSFRNWELFG